MHYSNQFRGQNHYTVLIYLSCLLTQGKMFLDTSLLMARKLRRRQRHGRWYLYWAFQLSLLVDKYEKCNHQGSKYLRRQIVSYYFPPSLRFLHHIYLWVNSPTAYWNLYHATLLESLSFHLIYPQRVRTLLRNPFVAVWQIVCRPSKHYPIIPVRQFPPSHFDAAVAINRRAMECCSRMLSCRKYLSQPSSSTSTMLLGTIFDRIISFYKGALHSLFNFTTSSRIQSEILPRRCGSCWLDIQTILRDLKNIEKLFVTCPETRKNCGSADDLTAQYKSRPAHRPDFNMWSLYASVDHRYAIDIWSDLLLMWMYSHASE